MLKDKTGYEFQNAQLFQTAMTHSSFANERRDKKTECNERLEFLGDSILGLIAADYLFHRFPDQPEGELTKLRACVVCENTLAEVALEFGIDQELRLGKGEEAGGGRRRKSILADAVEALLGAIYLDGGMEAARGVVMRFMPQRTDLAAHGQAFQDYKTALQEIVQKNREEILS